MVAADPRIGTTVGVYRIESMLGRGGMGVLYVAQHLRLTSMKVALKVLAPEVVADRAFHHRFVREADLAASMDHPNIVPVYDAGEADGLLYMAMRLVRGSDLRALLEAEGRLNPERALSIVEKVAGALDYAHGLGLLHRDVKPGNIMIEVPSAARPEGPGLPHRLRPGQAHRLPDSYAREGVFRGDLGLCAPGAVPR